MKLLRPLAGYTLYDHKTNDYISRELRITGLLDKIDEYRRNWLQHLQRMPQNLIPLKSYHYRPQGRQQLEDRRSVGASSCNSGDGMVQRVQSLMFMMMMMMTTNYKSHGDNITGQSKEKCGLKWNHVAPRKWKLIYGYFIIVNHVIIQLSQHKDHELSQLSRTLSSITYFPIDPLSSDLKVSCQYALYMFLRHSYRLI